MKYIVDIDDLEKAFREKTPKYMHTNIIDILKAIEKIKFPICGEWIGEADGYYNGELVYDTWYCSNCDYVVDNEEPPSWNFCPNCGASMKGADDELPNL